ncbi:ammonium transporter 3 member 2-like [Hibiscus syriacus]|uniref:ammonium transporter 3 member 2-like n=1 Tax=Hibiscus syriacus TaxID=106335 RepID=UPI0019239D9B|nr:ammonium transporter 3 member 2-like [Hibiscus syriacus]
MVYKEQNDQIDATSGVLTLMWLSLLEMTHDLYISQVDDTLGVFHTHAVAGLLGGLLTGLLAEPDLCRLILPRDTRGAFYGGNGGTQSKKQIIAALFVAAWNVASTTIILLLIWMFMPLRMPDKQLETGDNAVQGENACALWGDGENMTRRGTVGIGLRTRR